MRHVQVCAHPRRAHEAAMRKLDMRAAEFRLRELFHIPFGNRDCCVGHVQHDPQVSRPEGMIVSGSRANRRAAEVYIPLGNSCQHRQRPAAHTRLLATQHRSAARRRRRLTGHAFRVLMLRRT